MGAAHFAHVGSCAVDCEVPAAENILGKEGSGQAIFTHSMEWERTCILASHLGNDAKAAGNLREVTRENGGSSASRSESIPPIGQQRSPTWKYGSKAAACWFYKSCLAEESGAGMRCARLPWLNFT